MKSISATKPASNWFRIGTPLMIGLFVAYLDRTTLSIALPSVAQDMGFAGERFSITAGWALAAFLISYAVANFFGGMLTRN